MKSELFLIQSDLSEAYSQSILRSRSMFSEFREEGQGNLTAGIKKKPNDQKLRGVSDLIEGFFLNNFNLFRFTFWEMFFRFELTELEERLFVTVEGTTQEMYNQVLEKYVDLGEYTTGKLDVYLKGKKGEPDCTSFLVRPFTPMYYSNTSDFLVNMVYFISRDTSKPDKFLHRQINLREVMNLNNSENSGQSNKSLVKSIYYGDVRLLGLYLVDKCKSGNLFDLREDIDDFDKKAFEKGSFK